MKLNLFEYLPFPYGRRPKGSEVQLTFKPCLHGLKVVISERNIKLA